MVAQVVQADDVADHRGVNTALLKGALFVSSGYQQAKKTGSEEPVFYESLNRLAVVVDHAFQ